MMQVLVKLVRQGAKLPAYATEGSAGCDLCASLDTMVVLEPGATALIPTGLALSIPQGYEAQVRPRSGLAAKCSVTVLNTPGTIDSDYRGEVKVILINLGKNPFTIHDGDRIAQMVFSRYEQGDFQIREDLAETARGSGGFGSTGV